jgi:hypothetical protein
MFPWKKILMIVGFIAVIIIMALAIYYVFFKGPTPTAPIEEEKPITPVTLPIAPGGEIPTEGAPTVVTPTVPTQIVTKVPVPEAAVIDDVARGGITKVNDIDYSRTASMSLDSSGDKLMTYNRETGEFYRLSATGEKTLLTSKTFKDVENIDWAPKSSKAILEFPDGSNILYDFSTDKQVTLPKSWEEFQFSDSESQIAFKDMDQNPDKRFLAVASPDGSNQKYLEFLGYKADKVDVLWSPNNQVVATFRETVSTSTSKIYLIGQNQENFRAIEANGQNITMQYTPTGERLVYSAQNSYSQNKPVLYIVDAAGDNIGKNHYSLNLNTWADKCAFADNTTMYCAVPKEMPDGAGWFPELADGIGDYIYKVNLTNGNKSLIAEPEYDYPINQITVSDDGATLFFTDKTTNSVHQIKLK